VYNEFPFMGEHLYPPTDEMFDPTYAQNADKSDLWWRNLLENPTTVQFNHRCLVCLLRCNVVDPADLLLRLWQLMLQLDCYTRQHLIHDFVLFFHLLQNVWPDQYLRWLIYRSCWVFQHCCIWSRSLSLPVTKLEVLHSSLQ
jgi:hypothetical protein